MTFDRLSAANFYFCTRKPAERFPFRARFQMIFLISSRPLSFVFYPETLSARGTPKSEQLNGIQPTLTSLFTPALSRVKMSSRLPACSIWIHYKPVYECIMSCGSQVKPDSDVIVLWQKHYVVIVKCTSGENVRENERGSLNSDRWERVCSRCGWWLAVCADCSVLLPLCVCVLR